MTDQEKIERYREARRNYEPSPEEIYEMVAAFGPGAEVTDILTGQTITLPTR